MRKKTQDNKTQKIKRGENKLSYKYNCIYIYACIFVSEPPTENNTKSKRHTKDKTQKQQQIKTTNIKHNKNKTINNIKKQSNKQ